MQKTIAMCKTIRFHVTVCDVQPAHKTTAPHGSTETYWT